MSVSDKIRKSSGDTVLQLGKMGIEVYLVTGDNQKTAEAVAGSVGSLVLKPE